MKRGLALAAVLCLIPMASHANDYGTFIRVKPGRQTGQLKVWISDDGRDWRYIVSSAPYWESYSGTGKEFESYLFPLPYLPTFARVGVMGPHLGRVRIDSVDAVVKNVNQTPLDVLPVGEVLDAAEARVADGKSAIIVHRGQADAVDGLVLKFRPTKAPAVPLPPPAAFGVYEGATEPMDEQAKWLATFDFTVLQVTPAIVPLAREIKKLNPKHRIMLRLMTPNNCVLDYFYDQASRDYIRCATVDRYLQPLSDITEVATLSEEEPGNQMRGWFSLLPADFIYEYRFEFEKDTGKSFTWQSQDLVDWLGQKLEFMYDELYGYIKSKYPRVKVYQWVELRGYGNMSGWPEFVRGEKIRMDGYVTEWFEAHRERLMDTPLGPMAKDIGYYEEYISNLCAKKKLRKSQILGQVWAHAPSGGDVVYQIDKIREQGITDIYVFVPFMIPGHHPHWVDEKDMNYGMAEWEKMKNYMRKERQPRR